MSLPVPYYEEPGITIYHGDAYHIVPQLGKPHLLLTDPPYFVAAKGCGLAGDRQYLHTITDEALDVGFDPALLDGFDNWFCFCSKSQLPTLIGKAAGGGGNWMVVVWCKTNPTPLTNNNYLPDCEYVVHRYASGRLFGAWPRAPQGFLLSPPRADGA